jgi:hypothetical protein
LKNFIAGLVQSNYVVALDKTHLRCVELPEFVALAEEVKKRKAETKKNLQLYFDKDVASIISEYACLRSPSRNEVRLSQHYSSFYRSTNKKYEDLKLEIRMDNRAKGRQLISK